jgi:hypothetical protein
MCCLSAGIPGVTDALLARMEADEDAFVTFFGGPPTAYLKPDRMARPVQQLSDLRLLLAGVRVHAWQNSALQRWHCTLVPAIMTSVADSHLVTAHSYIRHTR